MLSNDRINEIKNREKSASAGPWVVSKPKKHCYVEGPNFNYIISHYTLLLRNDADFIANARTDIPLLLEEIEYLRRKK